MLFDFDIKYRTEKSNKAVDSLSCHPIITEEMDSMTESKESETISHMTVCNEVEDIIDGGETPYSMQAGHSKKGQVAC